MQYSAKLEISGWMTGKQVHDIIDMLREVFRGRTQIEFHAAQSSWLFTVSRNFLSQSRSFPPSLVCNFPNDLITTIRGTYGWAACNIMAVVLEVDLGRVNRSR